MALGNSSNSTQTITRYNTMYRVGNIGMSGTDAVLMATALAHDFVGMAASGGTANASTTAPPTSPAGGSTTKSTSWSAMLPWLALAGGIIVVGLIIFHKG